MALTWRDRARQGALKRPIVADDGHLGAVHPQRDPLPGQLEPDAQLSPGQACQADGTRNFSGESAGLNRDAGDAIARDWCGRSLLYSSRQASRAACSASRDSNGP